VSASDQSITRVNYFNGQRLDANDLRAEQDYQMAVRRKLYSALYASGGVIAGLEVTPHPTDQHKVVVAPGVALDFLGREVILLSAADVIAAGTPTTNPSAIFGNYLVISYTEQRTLAVDDGCVAGNGACGGNLAWGAATRIVAQPKLQFTDTFPAPNSGQIVLAQVALGNGCQVGQIVTGVRQYAVPAKPPVTRAMSLEGEKDIDPQNPKVLYFHIDGGIPSTVTLYLRAAQFSTLYYTELGAHTHNDKLDAPDLNVPAHTHKLGAITTGDATWDPTKPATINATCWNDAEDDAIRTWDSPGWQIHQVNLTAPISQTVGALVQLSNFDAHTHAIGAGQETTPGGAINQSLGINFTPASAGLAGPARTGAGQNALSYVSSLRVFFDGTEEITGQILTQLAGNDPAHWPTGTTLGDGTGTSPLVIQGDGTGGTGAIALDKLGLNFSPGQHSLTFQVATGGGQIQYNLYVG
jgi:hypothetical protein